MLKDFDFAPTAYAHLTFKTVFANIDFYTFFVVIHIFLYKLSYILEFLWHIHVSYTGSMYRN